MDLWVAVDRALVLLENSSRLLQEICGSVP